MGTEILARLQGFDHRIAILIRDNGYVVEKLHFGDQPKEGEIIRPTFIIDETQAQVLMDNLWDCGLRPSEGSGSAGALMAAQLHLEDMRRIVAKNLEVDFKKG